MRKWDRNGSGICENKQRQIGQCGTDLRKSQTLIAHLLDRQLLVLLCVATVIRQMRHCMCKAHLLRSEQQQCKQYRKQSPVDFHNLRMPRFSK